MAHLSGHHGALMVLPNYMLRIVKLFRFSLPIGLRPHVCFFDSLIDIMVFANGKAALNRAQLCGGPPDWSAYEALPPTAA
jgi:hypothetical protein